MIDRATMVAICAAEGISVAATPKVKAIAIPDPNSWNVSYTMPSGSVTLLIAFSGTYTANANVSTRIPSLEIVDDSGNMVVLVTSSVSITANQQRRVSFFAGATDDAGNFMGQINPLPAPMVLLPGWIVRTNVSGPDAQDRWTDCAIYGIEWS